MKIGIIGAGPAGSLCASELSKAGAEVLLFDYRGIWEKPCGGGVTNKALRRYPFLKECFEKKRHIGQIKVISPRDAEVTVPLQDPLFIYSRDILNKILLGKAVSEGALFLEERLLDFQRQNAHWQLKTEKSTYQVDFLVGADGVNSCVRKKLSDRFRSQDLMMTYGYRVYSEGEDTIHIKFFRNLLGYLWVFARPNNISFGICGRLGQQSTRTLKQYLQDYLQEYYPEVLETVRNFGVSSPVNLTTPVSSSRFPVPSCSCRIQNPLPSQDSKLGSLSVEVKSVGHNASSPHCEIYSALIPSLRARTLRNNKIQGPGWALLGDAAGFADPITCEGIYYALRSGELLAGTLIRSRPETYAKACEQDFVADFIEAAEMFNRFYAGRFLGSDFITRAVQTASRSKILRALMNSFVAGKQDYKSLRFKLICKLPRICWQVMCSALT